MKRNIKYDSLQRPKSLATAEMNEMKRDGCGSKTLASVFSNRGGIREMDFALLK